MPAQTFVVKRVGDHYEVQRSSAASKTQGSCWAVGGAAAMLYGLTRGGFFGKVVTLAGAFGVYHGYMSSNMSCCKTGLTRERRGASATAPSYHQETEDDPHHTTIKQTPVDDVEEAVMESFPASDAPASSRSVGA